MKKLLVILLALVMVLSMSVAVFAEDPDPTDPMETVPDSRSNDVEVKLDVSEVETTYHVTIEWESLEFTYIITGPWDPGSLNYGNAGTSLESGTWYMNKQGETSESALIKVTNRSNTEVNIEVGWEKYAVQDNPDRANYKNVTFVLSETSLNIDSAVNFTDENLPTKSFTVTPSGDPGKTPSVWKVGQSIAFDTIVVTLDEPVEPETP